LQSKHWIAVGVIVAGLVPLTFAGSRWAKTADLAVLGLSLLGMLVLIGYKAAQFWRWRHDPARREAILESTQLYPRRIEDFLLDRDRAPHS
jgi:hypothetical protein